MFERQRNSRGTVEDHLQQLHQLLNVLFHKKKKKTVVVAEIAMDFHLILYIAQEIS